MDNAPAALTPPTTSAGYRLTLPVPAPRHGGPLGKDHRTLCHAARSLAPRSRLFAHAFPLAIAFSSLSPPPRNHNNTPAPPTALTPSALPAPAV